ncbi:hypothetical protein BGV60_24465 [Burkholderia ubonensis]|nr:hypothetical protein BGV60_24465 [Burkholderia ubonensis]
MTMEVGDLLEHLKNRLKSKSEAGDAQAAIARREQDRYAQRVIVQQGDDAVTARAAKNLADKHPDNTVLVKADQQGNLIGLEQVPAGRGNVKVQVVGHGDVESGKLGGADAPTVARQIEQVKARLGEEAQVGKVALVGCQTACETDAGQPSLTERVQNELAKQGTGVGELTGRATYVKVDADGRKRDTTADDPDHLGPKRPTLKLITNNSAKEDDAGKLIGRGLAGEVREDPNDNGSVIKSFGRNHELAGMEQENFNAFYGDGSAEIFSRDGLTFMRMLKVPGQSLDKIDRNDLPGNSVQLYMNMISDLNEKRIIHGDMHPGNIMFDKEAGRFWPIDISNAYNRYYGGDQYARILMDNDDATRFNQILRILPSLSEKERGSVGPGTIVAHGDAEVRRLEGRADASKLAREPWPAASSQASSEPMRRAVPEIDKPLVRVAWEDPKTAAAPSRELEQAFSASIDSTGTGRAEAAVPQRGPDRYAQRVIVQQGDDAVTAQAAERLTSKHPENTVLVKADKHPENTTLVKAGLDGLEQVAATGGSVKVQAVGHGDLASGKMDDAKPSVRVAWEAPKSAVGQSHELEQAFSTPLPKGEAGQQAALERLGLVSHYLKSQPSLSKGERQVALQKLVDPELVVRIRSLASMSLYTTDKVGTAAVLGHAQLIGALLQESGTSPEQARKVFETLTESQKNPSYLNTLATNAVYDVQVAQALNGILKNLHQQMGADEAAAKEIRTKLLDRPIESQSKYDEEFYGRLFEDGSKKWMNDHSGSRLLAQKLEQSNLIPTEGEIRAAGLSKTRAKKYLDAVKMACALDPESTLALPKATEAARQLASALTPKALQRRERAMIERVRDTFVRAEIEKAEGRLDWMIFQMVQQEWQKAMTQAGLSDREQIQPLKLSQSISAQLASEPSVKNYLALVEANARASKGATEWPSGWAPEADPGNAVENAIHKIVPARVEGAVHDTMERVAQEAAKERAQEVARAKAEEDAGEAAVATATEVARRDAKVRAEEAAKRQAEFRAKEEASRIARDRAEEAARRETEARVREIVEREAMKRLDGLSETIQKLNREDERRSLEELEARYIALSMPDIDHLPSLRWSERASERQAVRGAEYIDPTGRPRIAWQ